MLAVDLLADQRAGGRTEQEAGGAVGLAISADVARPVFTIIAAIIIAIAARIIGLRVWDPFWRSAFVRRDWTCCCDDSAYAARG